MVSEEINRNREEAVMPSDWCLNRYEQAVEQGRSQDADAYQQLYTMWKERGL